MSHFAASLPVLRVTRRNANSADFFNLTVCASIAASAVVYEVVFIMNFAAPTMFPHMVAIMEIAVPAMFRHMVGIIDLAGLAPRSLVILAPIVPNICRAGTSSSSSYFDGCSGEAPTIDGSVAICSKITADWGPFAWARDINAR